MKNNRFRRGFTLIELLVVMSLIAILATLAIMFFPNAASSQVESRAALQVQSWLTMAKQRAMRDQAPRGVRLWVSNNVFYTNYGAGQTPLPNVVTDCQFIEQPPDFPGTSGVTIMTGLPGGATQAYFTPTGMYYYAVDPNNKTPQQPPSQAASSQACVMFMPPPATPTGSTGILANGAATMTVQNASTEAEFWSVQPGDYIEVLGTGLMHQIVQVGVPVVQTGLPPSVTVTPNVDYVVISPPLPYPIAPTASFRIMRAPRVTGDETLKMPDGTLIDLNTNFAFNNPLPPTNILDNGTNSYVDILFSPTGEVISSGVANSNINLWVRSPNLDDPAGTPTCYFRGAPTIISVFTKTGFVGAYPPSSGTPTTPYILIK